MSRKRAITTFLSRKFMITRSSIAFEDFLGSSIAPQVMPPWMVVVLTQILWKHMAVVSSDERDTIAGEQYCHQLKMYQLVKPLKESTKKWRKLATKLVEIPRKCNDKIMVFPATVTMGALNVRPRTNLAPLQDLVFIGSFRQVVATKYMIYNRYWAILAGGGHKIRKLGVFVMSTAQNFGPKDDYDWYDR